MRKHRHSQKLLPFWLYVGFSSACFYSRRCRYYTCSIAQAAPQSQPDDALTLEDVYRAALTATTFFHASLKANLFGSIPLPAAEKLSGSSASLQISEQNHRMQWGQDVTVQVTIANHLAAPQAMHTARDCACSTEGQKTSVEAGRHSAADGVQANSDRKRWKE